MNYLDLLYVALWAAIAVYCFFTARKYGAILYILGAFFVFMFGWYLSNFFLLGALMTGIYRLVFRLIALAFLAVVLVVYFLRKNR